MSSALHRNIQAEQGSMDPVQEPLIRFRWSLRYQLGVRGRSPLPFGSGRRYRSPSPYSDASSYSSGSSSPVPLSIYTKGSPKPTPDMNTDEEEPTSNSTKGSQTPSDTITEELETTSSSTRGSQSPSPGIDPDEEEPALSPSRSSEPTPSEMSADELETVPNSPRGPQSPSPDIYTDELETASIRARSSTGLHPTPTPLGLIPPRSGSPRSTAPLSVPPRSMAPLSIPPPLTALRTGHRLLIHPQPIPHRSRPHHYSMASRLTVSARLRHPQSSAPPSTPSQPTTGPLPRSARPAPVLGSSMAPEVGPPRPIIPPSQSTLPRPMKRASRSPSPSDGDDANARHKRRRP